MERAARLRAKPWWMPRVAQPDVYAYWMQIEEERRFLKASDRRVEIVDFGAGSLVSKAKTRKVSALASSELAPKRWGRRLAILRNQLPPGPVLELGTSLGVTTAYLATQEVNHKVITLEGNPGTLLVAAEMWKHLGVLNRMVPILGNIDETLAEGLKYGPFSLAVIDANHRSGPVQQYFEAILPHMHPDGCIVIDDIYWTPDMTAAWHLLAAHPSVGQAVDLYRQGWLFLRPNQARQRFVLRAL